VRVGEEEGTLVVVGGGTDAIESLKGLEGVHVMGHVSDVAALLALAKVCCSVLPCVAVWCSVLQCGAGCRSVVQGVAGCGRVCTSWGMSVTVMWLLCLP